jgi:peptidoglycan/xylan/chitin deacetylase (PgdA/CDA1 family)
VVRLVLTVISCALLALAWMPQNTGRKLALTFDDLPNQSAKTCDQAAVNAINNGLLQALRAHQAPAAGFVTESRACNAQELRRILVKWRDAGHELGNHTYSHWNIDETAMEEYTADILKNEPETNAILPKKMRFFRHPFLHTGKTMQSRDALNQFLSTNGYRIAPVTFDNQEWVFARVYQEAYERRDEALKRRVAKGFLSYMEEVTDFFEKRSRETLGREPAQVLLLHANVMNAETLGDLLLMFKHRGYTLVSLEEALKDPAYQLADGYAGPKGLSWIHRWALAKGIPVVEEPREPEWIAKLFAAVR